MASSSLRGIVTVPDVLFGNHFYSNEIYFAKQKFLNCVYVINRIIFYVIYIAEPTKNVNRTEEPEKKEFEHTINEFDR